MKICVIYLDDVIIFVDFYEEYLECLYFIFNRLRECNLKLNVKKCKLFQKQVKYVGFIVLVDGIFIDFDKVQKVLDWLVFKYFDDVCQFVGFVGFYR